MLLKGLMVEDSLRFVLPNDRSAAVAPVPARLICDRLWDLGVVAGAATAAVRISDALRSRPPLRADVVFGDREASPLLEAAKSYPPTWALLVDPDAFETTSRGERRRLVDTCLELVDDLPAADLEHLCDRLQAMTGRELLRDAGESVASGWSQGAEARALDGHPVDVLDPAAAGWSLLGALRRAALAGAEAHVDEITFALAVLAELITDPSLAHWNDNPERTPNDVRSVLARAEALTAQAAREDAPGRR